MKKELVTGNIVYALQNLLQGLKDKKPHSEIIAQWDKERGTDWILRTKQLKHI